MTTTQFVFDAIGTIWTIDISTPLSSGKQDLILKKIKKRIDIFDKTYSRFRNDSLVTKISQKKGTYYFPEDAEKLFLFYKEMHDVSNGAVTPLIGQALSDAGYDASYTLRPKTIHKTADWKSVLNYTHPELRAKKPVLLDFGAAGKGYLIDIIGKILKQSSVLDFCIDAGGDILQSSKQNSKIKIGLEHPKDPKKVIGVANISNQSICGSAGNRRTWGKFHHIINPYTLTSPKNILSTWAIADSALLADGMTTCLFFVLGKELKKKFDFEYFVLFDDYSYDISSNFPAEVYTNVGTINT